MIVKRAFGVIIIYRIVTFCVLDSLTERKEKRIHGRKHAYDSVYFSVRLLLLLMFI